MSGESKYRGVCTGIILVMMVAGIPVSAAGSGKLAVPGVEDSKCFGGSGSDILHSFQPTLDGGLILIGSTHSNDYDVTGNYGGSDVYVVKLSQDHSLEWAHNYGGSSNDQGLSICQTTGGGYVFSAITWSDDNDVHGYIGGGDIWVVRLNATGGIIWDRCLGGLGTDNGWSIRQTSDGGFIIAASTVSGNSGHVSGSLGGGDIWVVKLTSDGNIQWKECLGGSKYEEVSSIRQTRDRGYILVGYTYSNDCYVSGNHDPTGTRWDIWVAKLSENGMLQWQKCLGGSNNDEGFDICETSDGGYILIGDTYSNDGDVTGNHGSNDIWVVKLNSVGTIEWQRCFGWGGSEIGTSIEQTRDGGYIFAGATGSTDGEVSGNHGMYDYWVVKISAQGWPDWQRCLGGSDNDYWSFPVIHQNSDGSFVFGGSTPSTDGDVTDHKPGAWNNDIWIVRLFAPPIVNGIAPSRVITGTATTVVLTGENFIQNWNTPTVTFEKPGTEISLPVSEFQMDGTRITCDVTPTTFISPGVYSVRVNTEDNQYFNLTNAFTVTCGPAPTISGLSPASGIQGAVLNPVVIKGKNFWTAGGVLAYLNRTGQPNIGITITSDSATQLNGKYIVPAGAATGKWNLVVQNPDGQYVVKKDAFTVNARTIKPPRVSSVTPKTVNAGSTVFINGIAGSFFNASASVAMTGPRGVVIPVSNVTVLSEMKITCNANLTGVTKGYATVTVTNPDGKKSTRARAFSIR